MEITKRQLEILQHALGADQYGRIPRESRNYFCAGGVDEPDCRALVSAGLMQQHPTTKMYPYFNCSVTDAGKVAMKAASPLPPKLTRSQKRFERFRDWSDAYNGTFRQFLSYEKEQRLTGVFE